MHLILELCLFILLEYSWAHERIVGGRRANEGEFPYQLSLRYKGVHLCGAALVSENVGLSAAHCFPSKGVYTVRAGSIKLKSGGVEVRVNQAVLHPYHSKYNQDYDLAILKFATRLKLSPNIQPVKLPSGSEQIGTNTVGYVTGWGSINNIFPDPVENLRAVQLPVLSFDYCRLRYSMVEMTDRMFCVGFREGGRDSCQGDSGGPFVVNGTIYGIVSWGFNCAEPGYPGVYTYIPSLLEYIKKNSDL